MDSGNVAMITKKQRQATKWLKKPRSLSSSGSCFAEKKNGPLYYRGKTASLPFLDF